MTKDKARATESRPDSRHCRGVTPRVVIISLLLAGLFGYTLPIVDVKLSNTFLGATHLPPGSIAVLLALLLFINPLLRLLSGLGGRLTLSRNEVLTIYITSLFSCLVPGHGAENFFVTTLIAPFYFAAPDNKWLDFLLPNLKPWFTPALRNGTYDAQGRLVTEGWYIGLHQGQTIPWEAWLTPLLAWSSLVLATYVMLACLSTILRAQWSQHEALSFPLLRLPMEMTEDMDEKGGWGRLFRNKHMWMGFGIAAFIQIVNGLHFYFPDVPKIPLSIATDPYLTEAPWNQIGDVPIQVWPMAVGISYLVSSEISFSLWAFYWIMKFQLIGAWSLGYMPQTLPAIPGFRGIPAFASYQRIGAFIVYAALVLWIGRTHFLHVIKRAFGRVPVTVQEKSEPLSYPIAFWGFVAGFVFVVGWTTVAGVRLDAALALWSCYLIIVIGLTRLVAETGLLLAQHQWMPLGAMSQLFTSGPGSWLAPSSVVPATFVQTSLVHDLRGFLMPSFVHSFKLAHDRGIKARPLLALISVVVLVAFAMGIWMRVRLGYENGGLQLNEWSAVGGPKWPPRLAKTLVETTPERSWLNWFWLGTGMLLTYGMMLARSRYLWFPLHPLGYMVSLTFAMDVMWVSVFLGWLSKTITMKFGGSATYRKLLPFFLGLALGDVSMMLVWLVIDGWQGRTVHQLMPD